MSHPWQPRLWIASLTRTSAVTDRRSARSSCSPSRACSPSRRTCLRECIRPCFAQLPRAHHLFLNSTLGNITGSSSLVSALQQANLVQALDGSRGLTVFVPNNAAFEAAASNISGATPEQVVAVLANHVINGTVVYSFQLEGDDDDDDG